MDTMDCERCGGEFCSLFNTKSFEEQGACNRCGYFKEVELRRDESGSPVKTDDGRIILVDMEGGGFGILSAGGEAHSLEDATPATIELGLQTYDEYEDGTGDGFFTAWVDDELVCLRGKMPPSFQEIVDAYNNPVESGTE